MADLDVLEDRRGLNIGAFVVQVARTQVDGVIGQALADLVVDLLDLGEERVAALR